MLALGGEVEAEANEYVDIALNYIFLGGGQDDFYLAIDDLLALLEKELPHGDLVRMDIRILLDHFLELIHLSEVVHRGDL